MRNRGVNCNEPKMKRTNYSFTNQKKNDKRTFVTVQKMVINMNHRSSDLHHSKEIHKIEISKFQKKKQRIDTSRNKKKKSGHSSIYKLNN